jgi:galactokinase
MEGTLPMSTLVLDTVSVGGLPLATDGPRRPIERRPVEGRDELLGSADLQRRADRLTAEFAAEFGVEPSVVVAAPATVTLLGGPGWVDTESRLVVAVDRYALAAVRAPEGRGVEVATDLGFARGAGLGSRAAERCAVRLALRDLGHPDRLPWTAAELSARCGVAGAALLVEGVSQSVRSVALDLGASGSSLVAFDTGMRHLGVDGALGGRRRALRRAVDAMDGELTAGSAEDAAVRLDPLAYRCALHLAGERARIPAAVRALAHGQMVTMGELVSASHASLSNHLRVTSRQVDVAVDAALAAGAVGARMIGAGFGGSFLALVPRGLGREIATAVALTAAESGFPVPRALPLAVAGGAARLR